MLSFAQAKILGESLMVNPYPLPGDSEYHHLSLPGIRIHEANDYFGDTDKLITGVGSLSLSGLWGIFSSSLSYKGRFFIPVIKTRNDQPELQETIGVYAEAVETYLNNAINIYDDSSFGIKLNFGVGYTDVGEHGMVNLYRQIHAAIDSPIKDEQFGEKLHDHFVTTNYGLDLVFPIGGHINFILGGMIYNSKPFKEEALSSSFVLSFNSDFALSIRHLYITQKSSEWFDLREYRHQVMGGLRLFKIWTPSIQYVTPYIKGDDFGQWYLSPLSLTYPF